MNRPLQRDGSIPLLDAALQCNLCHDLSVQGIPWVCPMITPLNDETLRRRAPPLQVNSFGRAILKKNPYTPAWCEVRRNNPWLVTA
jgi:hypothetical protein